MFYAAFIDQDGNKHSKLYRKYEYQIFYADTFSPDTKILAFIEFKISGETYAERKEAARQLVIDFQQAEEPGLSYEDFLAIHTYFEFVAVRYGLLTEFRENGII